MIRFCVKANQTIDIFFVIFSYIFVGELVEMIKEYSLLGFPMDGQEVRSVAYDYAADNNLSGFSPDKEKAGRDWLNYFMGRHPNLAIKENVVNLSQARAKITREHINKWFDKYESVIYQLGITDPKYVWNVDETGTEDIPKKARKTIGIKGIKQYQTVCKEKPRRTTMLTYVNGAGFALPPMVIHRGKYTHKWRENCPREVLVRGSKKGYISKKLFAEYGKQLLIHLHRVRQLDKPNLILLDSHYAHVFNYCYMDMMYQRDVKVMALTAHCSHLTQPLDKNPFSRFKEEFSSCLRKFNRRVAGRTLRHDEFFQVFNVAWEKGMKAQYILAGYKRTGIWPVNREAVRPEQTAPSKICMWYQLLLLNCCWQC